MRNYKSVQFSINLGLIALAMAFPADSAMASEVCSNSSGYVFNDINFCTNNPTNECCLNIIVQNNAELINGNNIATHPECFVGGVFQNTVNCQARARHTVGAPVLSVVAPQNGWVVNNQLINFQYKTITEVEQMWATFPESNPTTFPNVSTYLDNNQPPSLLYDTFYTVGSDVNLATHPASGAIGWHSKVLKLVDESTGGSAGFVAAIPVSYGIPDFSGTGSTPITRLNYHQPPHAAAVDLPTPISCNIPQLGGQIQLQSRVLMVFSSVIGINCGTGSGQAFCPGNNYVRMDPAINLPASTFNNLTSGMLHYNISPQQVYPCSFQGQDYNVFGVTIY